MPIYAYRCEDCGHAQDFLQKMSDPLIDVCPNCGSKNFRKQLTAAGFQLKGGGWYVTDFRDNGKKDGKKGDAATTVPAPKTEGGGEGKSGEGKSDSKSGESSTPAAAPAASSTPASTSSTSGSTSSTPSSGTKAA